MQRESFRAYFDIFDHDHGADNTESSNSDAFPATELADNGWFVVTEADPALASITKPPADHSTADCRLRSSGAAKVDKLCGYLNKCKVGSRGARLFKRRWFVHADSCCKLLYYRTANDVIPLGEIHIAHATLTFDVQPDVSSHVFRIT